MRETTTTKDTDDTTGTHIHEHQTPAAERSNDRALALHFTRAMRRTQTRNKQTSNWRRSSGAGAQGLFVLPPRPAAGGSLGAGAEGEGNPDGEEGAYERLQAMHKDDG